MFTDIEWAKLEVPAVTPLAAASFALVGSFAGAILGYRSSVTNNRKNLFVNTITKERAEWRKDLRVALSELAKTTEIALGEPVWASATPSSERLGAFHAQRVAVKLRLNPRVTSGDISTIEALNRLSKAVAQRHRDNALAELALIEDAIQALLKDEWEKSKTEARTGQLEARK